MDIESIPQQPQITGVLMVGRTCIILPPAMISSAVEGAAETTVIGEIPPCFPAAIMAAVAAKTDTRGCGCRFPA